MKISDLKSGDTVRFIPPEANGNPDDPRCEIGKVLVSQVDVITCVFGNVNRQFYPAKVTGVPAHDEVVCLQLVQKAPVVVELAETSTAQRQVVQP